jgi:hypothetical protein
MKIRLLVAFGGLLGAATGCATLLGIGSDYYEDTAVLGSADAALDATYDAPVADVASPADSGVGQDSGILTDSGTPQTDATPDASASDGAAP